MDPPRRQEGCSHIPLHTHQVCRTRECDYLQLWRNARIQRRRHRPDPLALPREPAGEAIARPRPHVFHAARHLWRQPAYRGRHRARGASRVLRAHTQQGQRRRQQRAHDYPAATNRGQPEGTHDRLCHTQLEPQRRREDHGALQRCRHTVWHHQGGRGVVCHMGAHLVAARPLHPVRCERDPRHRLWQPRPLAP